MSAKTRVALIVGGFMICAGAALACPNAALAAAGGRVQTASAIVERALALVTVNRTDLESRRQHVFRATAFVVASDSKRSYLLTAYHVLCDESDPPGSCLDKNSPTPGLRCPDSALPAMSRDQLISVRLHIDPTTSLPACVEGFGSIEPSHENDLVLLRIDRPNLDHLKIAKTVVQDLDVVAAGYPAGILEIMNNEPGRPETPQGTVTWYNDAASVLRDTVATSAGDSGGPVFDMDGTVVGVVNGQATANGMYENAWVAVGPASIIRICQNTSAYSLVKQVDLENAAPSSGPPSAGGHPGSENADANAQVGGSAGATTSSAQSVHLQSAAAGLVIPQPPASVGVRYALSTGSDPASIYQNAMHYVDIGDVATAFTMMTKAAATGYAPAEAALGYGYYYGIGVQPDRNQGISWARKAADAGDYGGQRLLGNWAKDAGNPTDALTWYQLAYASMQKSAAAGDARAQYWLGIFTRSDAYGQTRDYAASLDWLQKASAKDSDALVELGWAYFNGKGVTQDTQRAFDLFVKAVNQGNTDGAAAIAYACTILPAQKPDYTCATQWDELVADRNGPAAEDLGWYYQFGQGVATDYTKAMNWYKRAVALGDSDGYDNVGNLYFDGHGVPKDRQQSFSWFEQGALYGDDSAQYDLAYSYEHGDGVARNADKAEYWYKLSIAQSNEDAMNGLGDMYYDRAHTERTKQPADAQALFTKAFALYTQAANLGEAYAEYSLGFMYEHGQGVAPGDYADALKWLSASAQQGNDDAMFEIGRMYQRGFGKTQPNLNNAYELFRRSADLGNADAENRVGEAYARLHGWAGSGFTSVPMDYKQALGWFNQSADQGNPDGLANLGHLYLHGYGVSQSFVRAGAFLAISLYVGGNVTTDSTIVRQELRDAIKHSSEAQIKQFALAWAKAQQVTGGQ